MNERKQTLLHIDDDPNMLRIVAQLLSSHGYDVISLDDPTRLQRELLTRDCRVVLLDIDMPQANGLEVLREVKRHDGGIQVIMLTGLVSMNTVLESMRLGAEACLFKPVTDVGPLLDALEAAFRKSDRWWRTLRELSSRRKEETELVAASRDA